MNKEYLECEKYYIFAALIFIAGFYGGYTMTVRGGLFANAASANMVLFAIAIAMHKFEKIHVYILSFLAYMLGTIVSEHCGLLAKKIGRLRWDTYMIGIEIIWVILLTFLPSSVPDLVYQLSINFICAMQFNTFRQAEGIGMATVFITNHTRQTGSYLTRWIRKPYELTYLKKCARHFGMILCFFLGALTSSYFGQYLHTKTLLIAVGFLIVIFIDFVHADLYIEKDRILETPRGH